MRQRTKTILFRAGLSLAVILALLTIAIIHYVRRQFPADIVPDINAAIAARHIAGADDRFKAFLEGRYGSLNNPTNRERALEGFFNPSHIKAMRLIVQYSPPDQRRPNIKATADWLANYRQSMSPQEKADLANYFASDAGQAALQGATAQFMSQDPEYRSATTPVINQLMTTLTQLKQ